MQGDGTDDVAFVTRLLTRSGPRTLSVVIGALHRTIELICVAAGLTGLVALLLGVWAWHHSLPGAAIAVAAGLPTLVIAGYVGMRTRALAAAIRRPNEVLAQAQDLVLRAKGSPELHKLAGRLRDRKAAKNAGLGRMRRAVRTGQLVSSVIGLASPDPKRHDLLIPFTPDRLRNLWLAVTIGLWAWLISAVMASLAFLSLAIQAL